MEMSGQPHALATLSLGKKPPVLIGQEPGWAPEPVLDMVAKRKSPFPEPAGNWTPVVQPVAKSLYRPMYPNFTT